MVLWKSYFLLCQGLVPMFVEFLSYWKTTWENLFFGDSCFHKFIHETFVWYEVEVKVAVRCAWTAVVVGGNVAGDDWKWVFLQHSCKHHGSNQVCAYHRVIVHCAYELVQVLRSKGEELEYEGVLLEHGRLVVLYCLVASLEEGRGVPVEEYVAVRYAFGYSL